MGWLELKRFPVMISALAKAVLRLLKSDLKYPHIVLLVNQKRNVAQYFFLVPAFCTECTLMSSYQHNFCWMWKVQRLNELSQIDSGILMAPTLCEVCVQRLATAFWVNKSRPVTAGMMDSCVGETWADVDRTCTVWHFLTQLSVPSCLVVREMVTAGSAIVCGNSGIKLQPVSIHALQQVWVTCGPWRCRPDIYVFVCCL